MLYTKINPVGIDVHVQKFQTYLHNGLLTKWGIDTSEYKCYGRTYRNQTENGYIAENYEGENGYKEVYFDDTLAAISFFGITPQNDIEIGTTLTDAHLVFFLDLAKLKPAIAHRADEEIRKDIMDVCGLGMYGFNLISVAQGIENVLREYPGSRRDDRLKFIDMHPRHCYRINYNINYSFQTSC